MNGPSPALRSPGEEDTRLAPGGGRISVAIPDIGECGSAPTGPRGHGRHPHIFRRVPQSEYRPSAPSATHRGLPSLRHVVCMGSPASSEWGTMKLRVDDITWREIDGDLVILDLRSSTYLTANAS